MSADKVCGRRPVDMTLRIKRTPTTPLVPPDSGTSPDSGAKLTTPDAPVEHAVPKRSRFTLRSAGASWLGRVGVGVGVAAVVLGGLVGQPGAMTERPGPTVEQVATQAPRGDQIHKMSDALRSVGALVAPNLTREMVAENLRNVTVSVQLDEGLVPGPDGTGLEAPPGTRLEITLGNHGFTIRAQPAVVWHADWLPDPTVRSVSYSFRTASFTADAEGPGPDSWYESSVASAVDERLRPQLPSVMQAPGYAPFADTQLEDRLQAVVDLFVGSASETSRSAPSSAPGVAFSFRVPEDARVPLGDGESYAWIDEGTIVDFSTRLDGSFSDLSLRSMQVRFSQPVEIMKGEERDAILSRMELSGLTLRPNAEVSLDYRLGPEEAVDGVRALALLIAVAVEPRARYSNVELRRTEMEGLRSQVQERVDGQLEPRLVDLIRDNDAAIPGISLIELFGVER